MEPLEQQVKEILENVAGAKRPVLGQAAVHDAAAVAQRQETVAGVERVAEADLVVGEIDGERRRDRRADLQKHRQALAGERQQPLVGPQQEQGDRRHGEQRHLPRQKREREENPREERQRRASAAQIAAETSANATICAKNQMRSARVSR